MGGEEELKKHKADGSHTETKKSRRMGDDPLDHKEKFICKMNGETWNSLKILYLEGIHMEIEKNNHLSKETAERFLTEQLVKKGIINIETYEKMVRKLEVSHAG